MTTKRYQALGPLLSGEGSRAFLGLEIDDEAARPIVLIWVPEQITNDESLLPQVQRETERAATLQHPNIIHVHGLLQTEEGLARVVEFADGESLRRLLEVGKRLPPPLAALVVAEAASGVHHAHCTPDQPVLHGDLRPETVMVTYSGCVKVSGYGALWVAPKEMYGKRVKGRRLYAAPEQVIGGREAISRQTDVYLLGMMLYETLTGEIPFKDAEDVYQAVLEQELSLDHDAIPSKLRPIIAKATAKKAADRFPSALALRQALEEAMGGFAPKEKLISLIEKSFRDDHTRDTRLSEIKVGIAEFGPKPKPPPAPVAPEPPAQAAPPAATPSAPAAPAASSQAASPRPAAAPVQPRAVAVPPPEALPPRGAGLKTFIAGGLLTAALLVAGGVMQQKGLLRIPGTPVEPSVPVVAVPPPAAAPAPAAAVAAPTAPAAATGPEAAAGAAANGGAVGEGGAAPAATGDAPAAPGADSAPAPAGAVAAADDTGDAPPAAADPADAPAAPPKEEPTVLDLLVTPPVSVLIDGKPAGKAPLTLRTTPGSHKLTFVDRAEGLKIVKTVVARKGQTTRVDITLGKGAVAVNGPSGAKVTIDGKPMGTLPLAQDIQVWEGPHHILVDMGGGRWQQHFDVGADERMEFEVGLEARGE